MTRKLTLLLAAGTLLATAALAADWPRYGGPDANHLSSETGLNKDWAAKPPPVLWQVPLSDDGYAGPIVTEGKVIILDHRGAEDVLRALDIATGKEAWVFSYPDPGNPNYGFAHTTPAYDDGLIYSLGRKGQLNAVNAADGKLVWSKNIVADFGGKPPQWLYAASPIVDGDRVVVVAGGATNVIALNKKTGETIWAGGGTFDAGYATPVVATINGVKQYLVHAGTALTGVNAESGQVLWQVPWETKYGINAAMPVVDGAAVFAASGYGFGGGVFQIAANGPQQVWFSKAISAQFSSPVYYKGYVYSPSDPGDLVCLAPKDGSVMWRKDGFEKGGLIIVDDAIITFGAAGDLVMCAATTEGYKELGRVQVPGLGGQSWTAPILSDGKLIIRNKGMMACLDLK